MLGARQVAIAAVVIAAGRSRGLGDAGARVALVTALQESKLRNYANANVPASLDLPHDDVGSDYDSLGVFQQRPFAAGRSWGWGTVAQLMDVAYATKVFYDALERLRGWRDLAPGVAAQKVQISAFPDAYAQWVPAADALLRAL